MVSRIRETSKGHAVAFGVPRQYSQQTKRHIVIPILRSLSLSHRSRLTSPLLIGSVSTVSTRNTAVSS